MFLRWLPSFPLEIIIISNKISGRCRLLSFSPMFLSPGDNVLEEALYFHWKIITSIGYKPLYFKWKLVKILIVCF